MSMSKHDIRLSHLLSKILRHTVFDYGLSMDSAGYVSIAELQDVLRKLKFHDYSSDTILATVEKDQLLSKGRFGVRSDPDGTLFVRAHQGHSSTVADHLDPAKIYTEIVTPIPVCVHGTTIQALGLILGDTSFEWVDDLLVLDREWPGKGLLSMNRSCVHFASGVVGDNSVKSGMRTSASVYIFVDMAKALADGVSFYLSDNGVILVHGQLHWKYFSKIQKK